MGVLNTQDRAKRAELLNTFVADDQDSDEISTVEDDVNVRYGRQRLKRSQTSLKSSRAPRPESYIKNTGRKAKGSVNSRKFENAVSLSHLIETEEFSDLSIADFMVKSASAFERLFEDKAQMNTWSEFVNLKGEDQDRYLCESMPSNTSERETARQTGAESDVQIATKSFENVDHKIKSTLKCRNISMSGLKYFEEEVLSFFVDISEAVLVSLIPSSMDRLLVHGICQYMNLTSQSGPKNVMQIENSRNQFQPPVMLLSQYLTRIR